MSCKGSFDNQYEEYNSEASNNILDESKNQISEKFKTKLHNFKESKLDILLTRMEPDIFYDATVYTGSAGLAMYYLMSPPDSSNPTQTYMTALQYLKLGDLKGRRISFLCGDAGPLALATVITYHLRSDLPPGLPDYETLAKRLMSLISLMNDSPDEILYGKSGYLYALLFVNKQTSKEIIPANHILKVIDAILKSGKQYAVQMKVKTPLLWQWHDKIYFGAAHGMAGILTMLLQARTYINVTELRSFIKPAVDWLLEHQYSSGNFPSSLGSAGGDRLVQWCHGAPGFMPLCIAAYQAFKDEKYLKVALKCGEVIWERGLCAKGYSICHGVSGNAYAFLQLYQVLKRPQHLYRACCFMEWCAVERKGSELRRPDRPASLFEGVIGRLYLAEDIQRPMEARFPGLCL